MWAKFCGFLLKKLGWKTDDGPVPEKKAIILGVPHTSMWDFVISYLFYRQFNKTCYVMVKKEAFIWPLSLFLKKAGAIPVDRTNATSMIKSVISRMESEEEFVLAIAPEGSRKPVKRWKTGYHTIASGTGCPVYMGYFDWGTKHVGIGKKVELTGDAKADTQRIQELYEKMNFIGKHPEKYITK